MEKQDDNVRQLLNYASSLQLREYMELSKYLEERIHGEALGEVLLSRAQVKLLATDPNFSDDLVEARRLLPEGSRYAPLLKTFTFNDPNGFIAFSGEAGSIQRYLTAFEGSARILNELCGDVGLAMGRQIESEILYYSGRFEEARSIARSLNALWHDEPYDRAMMAYYVHLRCSLALGEIVDMEQTFSRMIGLTKKTYSSLDCSIYQTVRMWLNLTTGWSGESPRYIVTPSFSVFSALEDRADAIKKGMSRLGATEAPYAEYAQLTQHEVHTMRGLYTEIYNILLIFQYSEAERALDIFDAIYPGTRANNMVMPFAECGKQIVPFLKYASEERRDVYDKEWMDQLIQASNQFEGALRKLREEEPPSFLP